MKMTQVVEKEIDVYDWMLESYGRKHFEDEKNNAGKKENEADS